MGRGYRGMLTGAAMLLAFAQCAQAEMLAEEMPPEQEAVLAESCESEAGDETELNNETEWEIQTEVGTVPEEGTEPETEPGTEPEMEPGTECETESGTESLTGVNRKYLYVTELWAGDAQGQKVYDGTDTIDLSYSLRDEEGNEICEDAMVASAFLADVNVGIQEAVCTFTLQEDWAQEFELARPEEKVEVYVTPRPIRLTVPDGQIEEGRELVPENIRFFGAVCAEGFLTDEAGTSLVPDDLVLPKPSLCAGEQLSAAKTKSSDGNLLTGVLVPQTDAEGNIEGWAGQNYYFDPEQIVPGNLRILPADRDKTETEVQDVPDDVTITEPDIPETETHSANTGKDQESTEKETEVQEEEAETQMRIETEAEGEKPAEETEKNSASGSETHAETEASHKEDELPSTNPVLIEVGGATDGCSSQEDVELRFSCEGEDYLPGSVRYQLEGPAGVSLPAARLEKENAGGMSAVFAPLTRDGNYRLRIKAQNAAGETVEKTVQFTVNKEGSSFTVDSETQRQLENYTHEEGFAVVVIERNPDPVEDAAVMIRRDGQMRIAVGGKEFSRTHYRTEDGMYVYTYTLPAALFEKEGEYEVFITSRDKAGNVSGSHSGGCEIAFAVRHDRGDGQDLLRAAGIGENTASGSGLQGQILKKDTPVKQSYGPWEGLRQSKGAGVLGQQPPEPEDGRKNVMTGLTLTLALSVLISGILLYRKYRVC